jgi:type II secretory pathway component PulF
MIDNSSQSVPDSSRLVPAQPLDALIRMVASSDDAVEGLQAVAAELGGRAGQKVANLADRLRRGAPMADESSIDPESLSLLQASAIGDSPEAARFHGSRLTRCVMLEGRRSQIRTSLRRIVWFGLFYALAASLVGMGLQRVVVAFASDFGLRAFRVEFADMMIVVNEVSSSLYVALVLLTLMLMVSWAVRGGMILRSQNRSKWLGWFLRGNESFWNRVPFVGSTYRAIDLAEMSEEISQALSVGWTFPLALRTAANQSKSATLRRWLWIGASHLDRGDSFESVLDTCPLRAHWLRGMSQLLSSPKTTGQLAEQWRSASDGLHHLMINRGRRAAIALVPATVIFSVSVLLLAWVNLMSCFLELLGALA